MSEIKCPKCGGETKCLAGESAHHSNWYCEDETKCGWQAWNKGNKPMKPNNLQELISEMEDSLILERLEGIYRVGDPSDSQVFGTRSFADFIPPISLEAAKYIKAMLPHLQTLSGLRENIEEIKSHCKTSSKFAQRVNDHNEGKLLAYDEILAEITEVENEQRNIYQKVR